MRPLLPFAIAALLLSGGAAHANWIPPDQLQWAYKFTPGSILLTADGNPLAGVTFTNEALKSASGSSDVMVTNLRVISDKLYSADPPRFDTLTESGAYSLRLNLSMADDSGTHSAELNFTGKLSGFFSSENANIMNEYGPDSIQTVLLGSYHFDVNLSRYTPPGPPDQPNPGMLEAHVSVYYAQNWSDDGEGSPEWSAAPEPATILLSLIGLGCLGGAAWRRRKLGRS